MNILETRYLQLTFFTFAIFYIHIFATKQKEKWSIQENENILHKAMC